MKEINKIFSRCNHTDSNLQKEEQEINIEEINDNFLKQIPIWNQYIKKIEKEKSEHPNKDNIAGVFKILKFDSGLNKPYEVTIMTELIDEELVSDDLCETNDPELEDDHFKFYQFEDFETAKSFFIE